MTSDSAIVFGNGTSRLTFDLHELNALMVTYGCNAFYRDMIPDYLVSMDSSMVDEIIKSNCHKMCKFYTQHSNRIDEMERNGEPINFVSGYRETFDSGNTAIRLALKNGHELIYLVGFDYSPDNTTLPNVYSGTPNYQKTHASPSAGMRNTQWIQRLRKTCKDFPDQQIVRVNGTISLDITSPNYTEITTEQFKELLNDRIFV